MKMNGNRILTICLALSLLVHAACAFLVRPLPRVDAKPEQPPTRVGITIETPPPPTPRPVPPPPRPRSATPDQHAPSHHPAVHVPVTIDHTVGGTTTTWVHSDDGVPNGDPVPVETASPAPTPSPKPACSNPNVPASTLDVVAPSIPEAAGPVDDAQAQVRVTLEASGSIAGVQLYRPSGNPVLDHEALRVARMSTYRAEIRDCVAVAGDYLFTVDFKE